MQTCALRLSPGQDLKLALKEFADHHHLEAGIILTAIGSFDQAVLRFAGQDEGTILTGPLELISLAGTLSPQGLHLHGAVADGTGTLSAGHIMAGCVIRTTAEIVVANLPDLRFRRLLDPETGYPELAIEDLSQNPHQYKAS